ncbi:hypothetical protein LTR10_003798 [Elasticomyces elasticus]|nr:hypothetical protein LTR10_003798 [Elasticomyces elasticus]
MVFLIPRDTPYWRPGAEASEPETKSVQPPAPNIHALSEFAKGLSERRIRAMADKYDIPTLCSLAIDRLQHLLEPEREHVEATISAIQAIDNYTSGNQLWDIVVPMIVSNMDWLSQEKEFLKFLVEDMPVLTKTLLGSMAAKMPYNVRGTFR